MSGTNPKMFQCTMCPAAFCEIMLVKWHWFEVHKLMNVRVCKICEIPFPNKKLEIQHRYAQHGLFCPVCGKLFNNTGRLDEHAIEVHNTPIDYQCRICGMKLKRREFLINHLKEHEPAWSELTGPLIFKCKFCREHFCLSENDLHDHEKIHNKTWDIKLPVQKKIRKRKAAHKKKKTERTKTEKIKMEKIKAETTKIEKIKTKKLKRRRFSKH